MQGCTTLSGRSLVGVQPPEWSQMSGTVGEGSAWLSFLHRGGERLAPGSGPDIPLRRRPDAKQVKRSISAAKVCRPTTATEGGQRVLLQCNAGARQYWVSSTQLKTLLLLEDVLKCFRLCVEAIFTVTAPSCRRMRRGDLQKPAPSLMGHKH